MTALLLKDLQVLRPYWWLILPGHVLFAANGIVSPESFFGMNVALAWAYTVILLIIDWKEDGDRFVASLPVSREDMVRARYAGALGAAGAATVLYGLYGTVLLRLGGERLLRRWPGTPGWDSVEGLLAFFLVVWLVSVAYLPFYFRWGLAKGTWFFVASLAPVIVGGALLTRGQSLGAREAVESAGPVGQAIAGLVLTTALGWGSLRLAVRAYGCRDV